MQNVKIADKVIGENEPCFVIAEAGVNHNGDIELAKKLVDIAKEAGADAIKFQTFKANRVASIQAPKAEYQLNTTNLRESQLDMLQCLELSYATHRELTVYCQKRNILFISTPFDNDSVDFLDELGVSAFKIGSGEITNWPFIEMIARKGKPIILSTGMSSLGEVDDAVRVIRKVGCDQFALLHCVSNYPADASDTNLRAISVMSRAFGVPVGYSDHTLGIEIAFAAVALGAHIIEKHFTLNKHLPGPDHAMSLEPLDLKALIAGIRNVESALGNGIKVPTASETNNRRLIRRSLAAAIDIPQGVVLKAEMLIGLRPATGISPNEIERVIGRRTKRPLTLGDLIDWGDLE